MDTRRASAHEKPRCQGGRERLVPSVLPIFRVQSSDLRLLPPDGSLMATVCGSIMRHHFGPEHILPPGVGLAGRALVESRRQAGMVAGSIE